MQVLDIEKCWKISANEKDFWLILVKIERAFTVNGYRSFKHSDKITFFGNFQKLGLYC